MSRVLYANRNLKELPENLPKTIEILDCSDNKLKRLPQRLPYPLKYLDCSNNQVNQTSEKSSVIIKCTLLLWQ